MDNHPHPLALNLCQDGRAIHTRLLPMNIVYHQQLMLQYGHLRKQSRPLWH